MVLNVSFEIEKTIWNGLNVFKIALISMAMGLPPVISLHFIRFSTIDCFWVGSLIFINDVNHDVGSQNLEVYKNILSANLQRNASKQIGRLDALIASKGYATKY